VPAPALPIEPSIGSWARRFYRWAGRRLGLLPIQRVVQGIRRRGVKMEGRHALAAFGGTGDRTDRHYAPLVASLDVWEIEPSFEPALRRNLPRARVKITDSYQEIKHTDDRFDFIILDNPVAVHGGHSEHFDLFPDIFRLVSDDAVLVIHVIPEADDRTRQGYPYIFHRTHLAKRRNFYGTEHPERIPLEQLARHYRELSERHGFTPEWHFFVRRWEQRHRIPMPVSTYYLTLKVKREVASAA
jgi:hypothetical protein